MGSVIYNANNGKYGVLIPLSSYILKNYNVTVGTKIGVMGITEYVVSFFATTYNNLVVAYTDVVISDYLGYLGYVDLTFSKK